MQTYAVFLTAEYKKLLSGLKIAEREKKDRSSAGVNYHSYIYFGETLTKCIRFKPVSTALLQSPI